jgi:hypothetical protein
MIVRTRFRSRLHAYHCWDVLARKGICCIADQQTCLPDSAVTDDDTLYKETKYMISKPESAYRPFWRSAGIMFCHWFHGHTLIACIPNVLSPHKTSALP